MSGGLIPATSLIGDALPGYALISTRGTAIGTIIPDVSVEEVIRETLEVVDQPVETGSTISDHAFLNPSVIEMRCGWSNSTGQSEGYTDQVRMTMKALQASRVPFTLQTLKGSFSNILIVSIVTTTDQSSVNALMCVIQMRELVLVSTQGAGSGAASGPSQNPSAQDAPQDTAAPQDLGAVDSADTPYFASAGANVNSGASAASAGPAASALGIGAISGSVASGGPTLQ